MNALLVIGRREPKNSSGKKKMLTFFSQTDRRVERLLTPPLY